MFAWVFLRFNEVICGSNQITLSTGPALVLLRDVLRETYCYCLVLLDTAKMSVVDLPEEHAWIGRSNAADRGNLSATLLWLPLEILDCILLHALVWPEHDHEWTQKVPRVRSAIFRQPVLAVCTALRARALGLISQNCVFVHASFLDRRYHSSASLQWDTLKAGLALIDQDHPLLLSNNLFFFEVEYGWINDSEIRQEREVLVFCYSFTSMLRLCQYLGTWAWYTKLSLSCLKPVNGKLKRCVCERILPILLLGVVSYADVSCRIESVSVSQEYIDMSVGPEVSIRKPAWKARKAAQWAKHIYESAAEDDAGLWWLYAGAIYRKNVNAFFETPLRWGEGETDPDTEVQDHQHLQVLCRNEIGNDLSLWTHTLEWNAATTLRDMFRRYGHQWVDAHRKLLTLDTDRFSVLPGWSLFPRSHIHIAMAYWGQALATDVFHRECPAYASYRDEPDVSKLQQIRSAAQDCCISVEKRAAHDYCVAQLLLPTNKIFQQSIEEMKRVLPSKEFQDIQDNVKDVVIFANYQSQDPKHLEWCGTKELYDTWGGADCLQYLPIARRSTLSEPSIVGFDYTAYF